MEEKAYYFKARFPDVDFRRILAENPDADFIKVEWTPEGGSGYDGIVLISKRGADRMVAAGIKRPPRYNDIKLDKNGENWRAGPEEGFPLHVIRNIGYFRQVLSEVKECEKQLHQIQVTAIR